MVENSEILETFDISKELSVWFGKVLVFVRICSFDDRRHCDEHSRLIRSACNHDPRRKFYFVKYFEVLYEATLPLDSEHCALSCHPLQWQNGSGESGRLKPAPEFGLILADSICECVHIVRADVDLSATSIDHPPQRECDLLHNREKGDMYHLFYVKRFFNPLGTKHDFDEFVKSFIDKNS